MCEATVDRAHVIGVAATLESALIPTCSLINKLAQEKQKDIRICRVLIDGANNLLNEGGVGEYGEIVSAAAIDLKSKADIVVLAQASMA